MARSLDGSMQEDPAQEKQSSDRDVEGADLKIALALGKKTMKEAGGLQALQQGIQSSKDPTQVVSKFLVQLIMKIKDSLQQQGVELSPSIVLSADGWLVQMIDFIETSLHLPTEFSEEVIGDVMETFKAMLQGQAKGQQETQAPQQGPPQAGPPQQAAPMMGG